MNINWRCWFCTEKFEIIYSSRYKLYGISLYGILLFQILLKLGFRWKYLNSIGEAQREGVLAIPSRNFQAHHAFFQIVILCYNLWRWMKILSGHAEQEQRVGREVPPTQQISLPDHTIRIARLKMLFVAAKIRFHGNRDEVLYSMHEQRAAGLTYFLEYLDQRRKDVA